MKTYVMEFVFGDGLRYIVYGVSAEARDAALQSLSDGGSVTFNDNADGSYGETTVFPSQLRTVPVPILNANQTLPVVPEPGSRLSELVLAYEQAKADADSARERLDGIVAGIKSEAYAEANDPTVTAMDIDAGTFTLHMRHVVSERIDTKKLRASIPAEMLAPFITASGSWQLRRGKA